MPWLLMEAGLSCKSVWSLTHKKVSFLIHKICIYIPNRHFLYINRVLQPDHKNHESIPYTKVNNFEKLFFIKHFKSLFLLNIGFRRPIHMDSSFGLKQVLNDSLICNTQEFPPNTVLAFLPPGLRLGCKATKVTGSRNRSSCKTMYFFFFFKKSCYLDQCDLIPGATSLTQALTGEKVQKNRLLSKVAYTWTVWSCLRIAEPCCVWTLCTWGQVILLKAGSDRELAPTDSYPAFLSAGESTMCSIVLHSFDDTEAGNRGFEKGREGAWVLKSMWRTHFRATQLLSTCFHKESLLCY